VRAAPRHTNLEKIMTKSLLSVLLALGILGSIAGCNTMAGFGKDMERAGEATQDSANRNR
jgi:predicted small secreted protein